MPSIGHKVLGELLNNGNPSILNCSSKQIKLLFKKLFLKICRKPFSMPKWQYSPPLTNGLMLYFSGVLSKVRESTGNDGK